MSKEVIKVADIRKGDLIRVEWPEDTPSEDQACRALEYIAPQDNYPWMQGVNHYLLERPEPVFPDEPTLGWATWTSDWGTYLAVWRKEDDEVYPDADRHLKSGTLNDEFLSFEEAVAVPKAALDKLREDYKKGDELPGWEETGEYLDTAIDDFLTEVGKKR